MLRLVRLRCPLRAGTHAGRLHSTGQFGPALVKQKRPLPEGKHYNCSFYAIEEITDPEGLSYDLQERWSELEAKGRVFVNTDGINAQMSVPEYSWAGFLDLLKNVTELKDVNVNLVTTHPGDATFSRLHVRSRPLVNTGFDLPPLEGYSDSHLSVDEWNEALDADDAILIDVRNHFEYELGRFPGAVHPDVDKFADTMPNLLKLLEDADVTPTNNKKVMMYCTGGIRCEYVSRDLWRRGYRHVHQLRDGIVGYLRESEKTQDVRANRFRGPTFMFHDGPPLPNWAPQEDNEAATCHQCGEGRVETHSNCVNKGCNVLFLQCAHCAAQFDRACSDYCQDILHMPQETLNAFLRDNPARPHVQRSRPRLRPHDLKAYLKSERAARQCKRWPLQLKSMWQ